MKTPSKAGNIASLHRKVQLSWKHLYVDIYEKKPGRKGKKLIKTSLLKEYFAGKPDDRRAGFSHEIAVPFCIELERSLNKGLSAYDADISWARMGKHDFPVYVVNLRRILRML